MSHHFFAPQLNAHDTLVLSGDEARHLTRVLRAQVGDRVILFDGQGGEASAEVFEIHEQRALLRIVDRKRAPARSRCITLATAVPKGERFDWLVEKATEIGVDRLIPLVTSRSVVEPRGSKLDRLRRTIVEASKQSGRSSLMELAELTTWRVFLADLSGAGRGWIADPSGAGWQGNRSLNAGEVRLVIGPEGGFTAEELAEAREAGLVPVGLGGTILRIETAAIVLASLVCCVSEAGPEE